MTKLQLWTRPRNYMGATWEGWYVFLSQTRDSDALTRSNFICALKAVKAQMSLDPVTDGEDELPSVTVVRESHWAVGWVEWIAIHSSDVEAREAAEKILERMEGYPVVDEDHFSMTEMEEANEVWANCYTWREPSSAIRGQQLVRFAVSGTGQVLWRLRLRTHLMKTNPMNNQTTNNQHHHTPGPWYRGCNGSGGLGRPSRTLRR